MIDFSLWQEGDIVSLSGFGQARIHQARQDCREASKCQWRAQVCELFPIMQNGKFTGWCREMWPITT